MPTAARVAVSGHPAKREVSSDNAVAVGSRASRRLRRRTVSAPRTSFPSIGIKGRKAELCHA